MTYYIKGIVSIDEIEEFGGYGAHYECLSAGSPSPRTSP